MKKIYIIGIVSVIGLCARAGLDTTGLNYVEIQAPRAFTNGTTYTEAGGTNAINISNYKGNAKLIVYASGNTTVNATTNSAIVLQEASAATGTFATVSSVSISAPSATSGTVQTISLDLQALKKWVRLGVTLQGTNSLNQYIGATLVTP